MSLLIALTGLLLIIGVLAARPRHGLLALWHSTASGGRLLRQLLPQSLLLLAGLELLIDLGVQHRLYAPSQALPMRALLGYSLLGVLYWRAAVLLDREHAVRREGEAALSDTSALLRAVSDNTSDSIFIRDRDGRFILANPALAAVLGANVQEIIGRTAAEVLIDPGDAAMVLASDGAVMQAGHALAVEESLHLAQGMRTFQSTKAPWLGHRGELLGVVGISTDITERKRTEDALRAHETQLEALVASRTAEVHELIGHLETTREEEKRAIARELHDELGSALTALSMHLSLLLRQMPADRTPDAHVVQINSLLASIVTTTRRMQQGLRPDKLDVFGIKTAIAEQVQEFAQYAGVSCKVSVPDENVLYGAAIDIALFRMVQEALNNIAKHAKASNVAVVLDDTDDAIVLTIRDDGIGLPENSADKLHTHGLRGMRERAAYLGGSVGFSSSLGGGTTIRVDVPKPVAAVAEAPAVPQEICRSNAGYRTASQGLTMR
ncbi:MAG: PAS domain-containing protein [Herminiimonas sp.]|nr:PAS domain-containing protein [Herminiimonas sp.]